MLFSGILLAGCAPGMPFHQSKPFAPLPMPPISTPGKPTIGGQIYQQDTSENWFSDHQNWRVGDVVTVDIEENATASNAINNTTSQKSSIGDSISSFFGLPLTVGHVDGASIAPNITGASSISNTGAGASQQSNTLISTISATVTKVLPDGDLSILGQAQLNTGAGTGSEWIRIAGIVRAEDIVDDTVPSTEVADARVEYTGTGQGYEAARMPWLARFFLSLWPF